MNVGTRKEVALRVSKTGTGIPDRYVEGVMALAEWGDAHDMRVESRSFRMLRNNILGLCERWLHHDWKRDGQDILEKRRVLVEQRDLLQNIASFRRSSEKLSKAIASAYEKGMKAAAPVSSSFESRPPAEAIDDLNQQFLAVQNGLIALAGRVSLDFDVSCRFGPVRYIRPPKLARKEVVIALTLADRISFWRQDHLQKGGIWNGTSPIFSKDLPWAAIWLFSNANTADTDDHIDLEGLQTRVRSHARSVQHMYPFGDMPKLEFVSVFQPE